MDNDYPMDLTTRVAASDISGESCLDFICRQSWLDEFVSDSSLSVLIEI